MLTPRQPNNVAWNFLTRAELNRGMHAQHAHMRMHTRRCMAHMCNRVMYTLGMYSGRELNAQLRQKSVAIPQWRRPDHTHAHTQRNAQTKQLGPVQMVARQYFYTSSGVCRGRKCHFFEARWASGSFPDSAWERARASARVLELPFKLTPDKHTPTTL